MQPDRSPSIAPFRTFPQGVTGRADCLTLFTLPEACVARFSCHSNRWTGCHLTRDVVDEVEQEK